jgi:hypothetical protein
MNRLNPPAKPGKFTLCSDSLLAILGMAALLQIVLCWDAGSGLVEHVSPIHSALQAPRLETNAPWTREDRSVSGEKLSGFQSTTLHG